MCGNVLVRRGHEASGSFRKRKTCDKACGIILTASKKRVQLSGPAIGRPCPACGAVLIRRPKERVCEFVSRQHCNRECRHQTLRAPYDAVVSCKHCHSALSRKVGEDAESWRKRRRARTCGSECAGNSAKVYEVHGLRLTGMEIAVMLGVPLSAIKSRLRRGGSPLHGYRRATSMPHASLQAEQVLTPPRDSANPHEQNP